MLHKHKIVNIITFVLIALFLGLTVVIIQQTLLSRQEADEKNLITFTASSPGALKNKEFIIDVAVEKLDAPIQGVYFTLTYPEHKMVLTEIDDWNSPFDMTGEEIAGNGLLKYGRDSSKPLIGDQKVARLKFKTSEAITLADISVTGDASIVDQNLKNIISQRPMVEYIPEKKEGVVGFFDWLDMIVTDFPRLLTK